MKIEAKFRVPAYSPRDELIAVYDRKKIVFHESSLSYFSLFECYLLRKVYTIRVPIYFSSPASLCPWNMHFYNRAESGEIIIWMFRDGLAFTLVYRYNFQPPKFQAGALVGLGGLNYTHVTVLNSATERMRRTGEHSDRYGGTLNSGRISAAVVTSLWQS